jgi:hypothetical protein
LHVLPLPARRTLAYALLRWYTLLLRDRSAATTVGGEFHGRLEVFGDNLRVPEDWPPESHVEGGWVGSKVSPLLDRASAWGAALAEHDMKGRRRGRAKITTYGFARVGGEIRLAVIRYLPAFTLPSPEEREPVAVGPHRFPVVLRPWLACQQAGASAGQQSNSCWVSFDADDGRRRGLLTALHALLPVGAERGHTVTVDALRNDPSGLLFRQSSVMDAALVNVADAGACTTQPLSSIVGYKPVRLLGSSGPVDTDVIEFSGHVAATTLGVLEQEPPVPMIVILEHSLQPGDSGCLALDLEPTLFGGSPAPYLIYQGRTNLKLAPDAGYGLLIEQARRVWNFSVIDP